MKVAFKIAGIVLGVLLVAIGGLLGYARNRLSHIVDKGDLQGSVANPINAFLKKGKSYGMVVGVVKNGSVYIQGFGSTRRDVSILPDDRTLFELASTSKLFTTTVLQLLVDEGALHLDDRIQPLLAGKVALPDIAANTTLRQLATHRSGFPSVPESFFSKMTDETNPYKDLTTADLYDYLKTCAGKQKEGAFEYSNLGMGLLGHILELRTGIPYEQLVKQRLLQPLGMQQTFVTVDSTHAARIAQGYSGDGRPAPIWEDHVLTGAGSFLSSAADMVHFIKANLRNDATAISPALIKTHAQQSDGETGLGWLLPTSIDRFMMNGDLVWHNGMAGGYASYLGIDKVHQCGLILLSNKSEDVSSLGMKLAMIVRTQSWKH